MMMTLLTALVLAGAPAAATDAKMTDKHEHLGSTVANPTFDKMKTLIGDWEAKMPDGKTVTVNYKLASNGTVLVETSNGGSKDEMITVYHADKDQVLMTHYCSSGTQPRMRAKKLDGEKIKFAFVDVSNAPDVKKGGFMSGLTVAFKDADHFTANWSMKSEGKDQPFAFDFTRVKAGTASGG